MQEVRSGVDGPAVCPFQMKSRKNSDSHRSPAQIWVLRAALLRLEDALAPVVPPLPVADTDCLWLITPSTPQHFGGLSQVLGPCQPPDRGRLMSAVPILPTLQNWGHQGTLRPPQLQAGSFLLPSYASPALFGVQ